MASPVASRFPTCMACLRRMAGTTSVSPLAMVQVRSYKTKGRPKDRGVLVRLLQDIPKFGRRDAIFRTERGRMRNTWYPHKQAEYMTDARFAELGLTKDAIGERDPLFGTFIREEDESELSLDEPVHHPVLETVEASRAHALLSTLLPETLKFRRKPIAQPAATPSTPARHPLLASSAAVSDAASSSSSTEPNPSPAPEQAAATNEPLAIHGSVSTTDVAALVRQVLLERDAEEAGRIPIAANHIRFTELKDGSDRVKTLGRWEVEIVVDGEAEETEPVRKTVEIVADTN